MLRTLTDFCRDSPLQYPVRRGGGDDDDVTAFELDASAADHSKEKNADAESKAIVVVVHEKDGEREQKPFTAKPPMRLAVVSCYSLVTSSASVYRLVLSCIRYSYACTTFRAASRKAVSAPRSDCNTQMYPCSQTIVIAVRRCLGYVVRLFVSSL